MHVCVYVLQSMPACIPSQLTKCFRMGLDTVHDPLITNHHIDNMAGPLVPDKHSATVAATHDIVIAPKVGLFDLHTNKNTKQCVRVDRTVENGYHYLSFLPSISTGEWLLSPETSSPSPPPAPLKYLFLLSQIITKQIQFICYSDQFPLQ